MLKTMVVKVGGRVAMKNLHPVYGPGGCAVMGRDLEARIRESWGLVRRKVTSFPDVRLPAHKFAGQSQEVIQAVSEISGLLLSELEAFESARGPVRSAPFSGHDPAP